MKYKVGDRVRIKSLDWYKENKDEDGDVTFEDYDFLSAMVVFCGKILTISVVFGDGTYLMKEDNDGFVFTNEMIEGLVEDKALKQYEVPTGSIKIWDLPNGYIFKDENGNIINATKIVLEKKKKEYPKTFEECVHVLEGENRMSLEQMNTFRKLIDARNVYWKIAGEKMGLGKPWEPDWKAYDKKYAIGMHEDMIYQDTETRNNKILAFPTEEMRDAFYENFKELINECKELL